MSARRILIYSHDTYGLGHLRRNLLIAERLTRSVDPVSVLVVTGSPRAQSFRLPTGCDTLKLPAVIKQTDGSYGTRSLGISLDEVARLRGALIAETARQFAPDLVLVDHAPAGMSDELRPLFDALPSLAKRPRMVLGLRDIIDEADVVDRAWRAKGTYDLLESIYDEILVYGDPRVLSTAAELGLEDRLPGRVRHVGYLGRDLSAAPSADPRPLVLAAGGGGGDAGGLLEAFSRWVMTEARPLGFRAEVVTGPLLAKRRVKKLQAILELDDRRDDGDVALLEFVDDFEMRVARAAAVVSMAGYNAAVEILAAGVPALFVPRAVPRLEQTLRARRIAALTGHSVLEADQLGPEAVGRFVREALAGGCRPSIDLDLGGLDRTAARLGVDRTAAPPAREEESHVGR